MGLFGKKKKTKNAPAAKVNIIPVAKMPEPPKAKVLFKQQFKQSNGFRGYKRFHVSYYGYKLAEEGIAKMRERGWDLKDADILLEALEVNDNRFIQVTVNGCLIGSVMFYYLNEEQKDRIEQQFFKGKVDGAHVRIEYENVINLSEPNAEFTQREKIHLFLHFPEES